MHSSENKQYLYVMKLILFRLLTKKSHNIKAKSKTSVNTIYMTCSQLEFLSIF